MISDTEQKPLRYTGIDIDPEANSAFIHDTIIVDAIDKKTAAESDPNLVDWDGEDDPEKPVNWTMKKKWGNGGLLAAMTFVTPLASPMFTPAVEDILGYCVGPLFVAPLSEMYGRVPVYHISNVLFVIFTIACAVSTSMPMLIVFRFFAGVMGSTTLSIGGGTFGDMFRFEERGAAVAVWSMGPLMGPVVGPIAGAFLAEDVGWRWVFWIIAMAAGVLTVVMIIFLRETYSGALLNSKAKRLRIETGNPKLRSAEDAGLEPAELFKVSIFRPIKLLLFSPIVLSLSVYIAFVYSILYLLFTTITSVFTDTYHFSEGLAGLAYLGIGIGMFLGVFIVGAFSDKLLKRLTAANHGVVKPEYRLPPMVIAGLVLPMGLFLYGWTAEYKVHWIVPIIGTGLIGLGLIGSFVPNSTYLIDTFGKHSASAIAANTVLRSLFGAFTPLAGPAMYNKLGLGWGNSALGFIALAMVSIPLALLKFGERLRTSETFGSMA